jgi:gamma-glutamyltranspeptidase/glutathione hydrolase
MVNTVTHHPANPGYLSEQDLMAYQAKERAPVCGLYRSYKICSMGPPSSGGITILQMLSMLERFDLSSMQANSISAVHLFSETGRLAYADRNKYIADPDFINAPVRSLLAADYLKQRSLLINPDKSMGMAQPGEFAEFNKQSANDYAFEFPSTSHIAIVDAAGNAVSMTTTIEDGFGSRLMVKGFLLNNQLTDFSFTYEEDGKLIANRIEPNKRPRSSMAPTMVFDETGNIKMIVGSPGGSMIINYVAKTLIGVLDWNLDMQQAIALPNFGSRNGPTEIEKGSKLEALKPALEKMKHTVKAIDLNSGLHGILRTASGWLSGADPRREGIGMGD